MKAFADPIGFALMLLSSGTLVVIPSKVKKASALSPTEHTKIGIHASPTQQAQLKSRCLTWFGFDVSYWPAAAEKVFL